MKVRRVDFCAGDWLGGTAGLSLAERGLYITACAMIYDAGGPIQKTELRQAAGGRADSFGLHLLKLIDKGKLQLRDGMIDQDRCEREIERARARIAEKTAIRRQNVSNPSVLSSPAPNDTNDLRPPTRAKVYQATKAEESNPKPSESVAAREVSNSEGGLGRFAPSREPAAAPEPEPAETAAGPPTAEDKAYVDAAVDRAVAAVRGEVPKGIRDPAAYKAAVTDAKFSNLVKNLNKWAGAALDGEALWAAWEVLAAAERAGARSGMSRAARKNFDKLDKMYRATGPPDEMARAA